MATVSPTRTESKQERLLERWYGTSASNTIITMSTSTTAPSGPRRLLMVTAQYSGAATQAGVTTTLDSGAGSGYDIVLNTGSANAQATTYIPTNEVILMPDDAIKVDAPAGGSVTCAVTIVTELLNN